MGFPFSIVEDFFRTIGALAIFGLLYLVGQGILNLIWKPIDMAKEKKISRDLNNKKSTKSVVVKSKKKSKPRISN